jgi:hypothetical protein
MDTPRHVGIRKPDDSHALLHVMAQEHATNLPAQAAPQTGQPDQQGGEGQDYLISDRGEFDVTISVGASFQSQREERSDFVDTLLKEAPGLQLPPPVMQGLLAKAIKMKDLGPEGDALAEMLDPQNQQGQQLASAQQQLAEGQQVMAEMKAELEKLKLEKMAKVIDNEYRAQQGDRDREVKLAVAEITAKSQQLSERMEMVYDLMQKLHIAAHERGMQAEQHGHEHELADKTAANAQITQASDQVHQATMAQQTEPEQAQP